MRLLRLDWRKLRHLGRDHLVHYTYTLRGGRCRYVVLRAMPETAPVTCLWCVADRVCAVRR